MFWIVPVVPAKAVNPPCCAAPRVSGPVKAMLSLEILIVPDTLRAPVIVSAVAANGTPSTARNAKAKMLFLIQDPLFELANYFFVRALSIAYTF